MRGGGAARSASQPVVTNPSQRSTSRRPVLRRIALAAGGALLVGSFALFGASAAYAADGSSAAAATGSSAASSSAPAASGTGSASAGLLGGQTSIELIPPTSREEALLTSIELIPPTSHEEAPATSGTVGLPMVGTSTAPAGSSAPETSTLPEVSTLPETSSSTTSGSVTSNSVTSSASGGLGDDSTDGITVLGESSEITSGAGVSGVSLGLWIGLGAVVLIAAAAIVAVRLRRPVRH